MKSINGTSNRILEINLTNNRVTEFQVNDDDRRLYLGGKGLGLKYLHDRMPPGTDPFGEDNYLAFMMGVLIGTAGPCSGRFAGVTKSPLTGIMLSCSCGGPFGMAFKTAGYDGLLIKGKSKTPVYLVIDSEGVKFKDADGLWGLDSEQTQQALKMNKNSGSLVIGPAGENKVLYANIVSGHRFLGRGGMGAVMGAKNLKAIVAIGKDHKPVPINQKQFASVRKTAIKYLKNNHFVGHLYRNFGTSANVNICNASGILPVNNFQDGSHSSAANVSGEMMKTKYNTKFSSCKGCTILCGHKGTFEDGKTHQIPEYETIGLLGTNLGIFDPEQIREWNDICGRMGLDTISAGSCLGWAMEATERGIFKSDLKFGTADGISKAIEDIAYRRGENGKLADGTRKLSEQHGGKSFAIHVKGMEMAAYDPRGSWGQGLSYAVANRGACHLSSTTMALEVFMGFLKPFTTKGKSHYVKFFENLFATVNSLHTCAFAAFAYVLEPPIVKYTPKPMLSLTMQLMPRLALQLIFVPSLVGLYRSITGMKISQREFLKAGARIHVLERYMNSREGISRKDDTLPDRFLSEPRLSDKKKRIVPLEKMLDDYYKRRGFNSNGIPTHKLLKKLGIEIQPS